jgi:hypothetical protein
MFFAISKVTSFTVFRTSNGSFSTTEAMSFDKVPLMDATKDPRLALPFLLVIETNV